MKAAEVGPVSLNLLGTGVDRVRSGLGRAWRQVRGGVFGLWYHISVSTERTPRENIQSLTLENPANPPPPWLRPLSESLPGVFRVTGLLSSLPGSC